jgi:hypothetical protein
MPQDASKKRLGGDQEHAANAAGWAEVSFKASGELTDYLERSPSI